MEALGDEYPAGLDTYSFVSRTELREFAAQVAAGDTLIDLGCGRGGPGLWVAGTAGAKLVGVDLAQPALAHARRLADRLGVQAAFTVGSFESPPLRDATADVVMTVDAFLFTPDKRAGFTELARVLRPGGRLAMTSWDYDGQPRNRPPQVPDHRPLAEEAGLTVLRYDETDDWLRRCQVFADFLLEHADEAAAEAGMPTSVLRAALRDMRDSTDLMTRRFLLVAEKPR
ncbi:methyltransferase domain-containing protein [Nocardioides sp. MAH-18]|uniref:Methyltransferase domain-containing protein n=2 Tax=Nocardioidaceae TaxID=85015 RepID=A0A6L6XPK0_9ACTN|nr:class I SAM-dependent methyltransferase [Nocardioides sp. CGMCC 1.13656]MVQ48643.1 methyltransferase domain-containing protein [Nocardioides sp. MAH-18]